jgi:hypothetical protein
MLSPMTFTFIAARASKTMANSENTCLHETIGLGHHLCHTIPGQDYGTFDAYETGTEVLGMNCRNMVRTLHRADLYTRWQ